MLNSRPLPILAMIAALAACSGPPEQRYAVPTLAAGEHVRIPYRSVVVRDVSLPDYASTQEVFTRQADGALMGDGGKLWADTPMRSITLELARYLTLVTGAEVASEPWPFPGGPEAGVEVRIEQIYADANGTFVMSGQYFAASESGRARSKLFSLSVPIEGERTITDIANARARVVRDLARLIATEGLR
jgi:uncharacterized lipoprotein YmbA